MNAIVPPIPLIPENAPFSPAQRAWLNGFLAGLYGGTQTPMSVAGPAAAEPEPEDFPWHDPVLELPERLAMAEGRPLSQRLMAAMGQLDCGQCGYMCQSYAAALAEGREGSISLCVPGAKPTQLALKRLMAEAPAALPAAPLPQAPAAPAGRDVLVRVSRPLTGPGSSKDVRHVVVDLLESGLSYAPGDSLGLAVPNDP
ncbi:MAG TPA: (Fe-S)-binding protein, partial [Acetobacteraceae bacterium]|nr:(Fe-S)-binding protein [Acetobacteraceae bacterium]